MNLTGILSVLSHILQGTHGDGGLDKMLLPGADRRLHSVFPKVFHASGMTPGILAFCASLFCCVRAIKRRSELYHFILLSCAGIVTLGAMPILVTIVVFGLLGAAAVTALVVPVMSKRGTAPDVFHIKASLAALGAWRFTVWLLLSLALSLPLLKYAGDLSYNSQDVIVFSLFNDINIKMSLAALALLIPLLCTILLVVRRQQWYELTFLLISIVIGLFIALGLSLPDFNQYKFHYLLAMLLALAWLIAQSEINAREGRAWPRVASTITAALILLSFCNLLYAQYYVIKRAAWQYEPVRYVGVGVETDDWNQYGARIPAYYWIAENTPVDSVIILDRELGSVANLYHERLSYVSRDCCFYARNIAQYGQRIQEMYAFFSAELAEHEYQALLESIQRQLPGRPLYAVVRDDEVDAADMAARGALRVLPTRAPAAMCIG